MNLSLKSSIALLSFFLVGVFSLQVLAAVPNQISYQGKLTDNLGTPLPQASYALTFRIFDAVSGGALLWAEDQTVSVAGGIYNVILGEGSTTTGSFDQTLFSGDNRWLEVVVAGEVLLPRQRVTSVAYALQAEEASLADDAETLAGYLPGDFSFAGHTHGVDWTEVASKPPGFADNTDDVGITTELDPTVLTSVKDGISWAEVTNKPPGFADNTDDVGITTELDPTVPSTIKDGISWGEITNRPAGLDDGDDIGGTTGRELIIDAVGIHDWTLSSTGDFQAQTGYFFIKDKTTDTLRFAIDQNSGLVSTGDLSVAGAAKINIGGGSFDFTTPGGWPGIIGLAPNGYRREIAIKNDYMWILAGDSSSAPDATHGITIRNSGNVGIGTASPVSKLHVNGTTTTKVLTITGGADIAEPFDIFDAEPIKPGMLMAIDPANPGQLKITDSFYDTRVAGIVSGAGGIDPGIILTQEGTITADGTTPIALSGRVYCLADATHGAISPGDMLTTSDTPGHAMRADDRNRSYGAVIGKAMTPLAEGTGHVLVLVSLQ